MRPILIAVLLLVLAIPSRSEIMIEWREGTPLPSARDNLGFGTVDGLLVVAGGAYWRNEQKHYLADTIAYSAQTGKWVRLPFMPRRGAYGAASVYNGQLLIAGGANETDVLTSCTKLVKKNDTYRWENLPSLPHPVSGARGAVVGGKFLVISGSWGVGEEGFRASRPTLLELDMANPKSWKESDLPEGFRARTGTSAAVIGDRLFVFGGYGVQPDGTLGNFGDAWMMRNGRWKRIADLPVPSRWTVALPLDGKRIGLFGGYGEDFLAETLIYDVEKDSYTKSTPLPLPVCNLAAGTTGSTIYLAGGEDIQRHRSARSFTGTVTER